MTVAMLFSVILAATVAATPAPSLAPLKTIANVRSTPFCTALRTHVVPAIAALLSNDVTIDQSPAAFDAMYRHALLEPKSAAPTSILGWFDLGHLTYLIGPMVNNLKRLDDLLADSKTFPNQPTTNDEKALAQIKKQLEAVEKQQKDILNVVSGYYNTAMTHNILEAGNDNWNRALEITSSSSSSAFFNRSGFFGPSASAGSQNQRFLRPLSSPGRFDVSLAYNPFRNFSDYILMDRAKGASAEATAASFITPFATSCAK